MRTLAGPPRRPRHRHRPAATLIPAIHPRGTNVGGLLRYLFGPGKREEHRNPHLIAAWSGPTQLSTLEPATTSSGHRDVRTLAHLLEQPVRAGRNPPQTPVWHASVRNHPGDRTLTDAQWAHIAAELLAAVGLAPHGDPDAVRWVAIRHADNHIHIVATLVRQDGETVWAWNERSKAQAAARDLEQRYGLHRVGPADHTSHHRPTAAEQNKAHRQGRTEIPRDRLRREVRAAAAAAADETDLFTTLKTAGILVRLRHSTTNPDQITGYAVGLPDHHTATGDTIWYGGGRLAPDLTLPRLRQRWRTSPTTTQPATRPAARARQRACAFRDAATATYRAAEQLKHRRAGADDETAAVAGAASDVLASAARAFEGRSRGPLTQASEILDRAAREPYRRQPVKRSRLAGELRSVSRLIAVMGRLAGDHDTAAALQLLLQMSMLADNLADLREAQQRLHQARAARHAAELLIAAATAIRPAANPSTGHQPAHHADTPPHARGQTETTTHRPGQSK